MKNDNYYVYNYDEKKLYVARFAIRKNMRNMDGQRIYQIWSGYWKNDWRLSGNKKVKLINNDNSYEFTFKFPLEKATDSEVKELKLMNMRFKELQAWMNCYLRSHTTIDDVDNDIIGLRDKQRRILISKYKHLNYYVKAANQKINNRNPIQYYIWKGTEMKNGSFDKLMEYYRELKRG